jgi:hypothetical protein
MTQTEQLVDAQWRMVREDEVQTVLAVHLEALAGMESGLVRPDSLEHFACHISKDGVIIGAFVNRAGMVAYGVLGMRSETADHMADILQVDAADRSRFCILDGAASLPAWRGNRLHRDLIRERVKAADTLGRTLLGATVSPSNMTSMRGLLESQFEIRTYGLLYGGLPRLVMQRDLRNENRRWVLQHKVLSTDAVAHQAALAEGLNGFACEEDAQGKWLIHYGYAVS